MTDHNPAEPYPTSPYPEYSPPAQVGYAPMMPPPAPKKSRLWLWLGISAVALVLCCGGGTTAGMVLYNASEQTAAEPIALPSVKDGSPSPTASPTGPTSVSSVKLIAPTKLAGYPRINNATFDPLLDTLKTQMESLPGIEVEGVVSGVYGNLAKQQLRLLVAVKTPIPNPEAMPDSMLVGLKASGAKLSNFAAVPAGPLGGSAQCGDIRQSNIDMAMCVWADNDSFGVVFFYFVKAKTVKSVFLQARSQVESRV